MQKRAALHNIKITGERASANEAAAEEFPAKFKDIVRDGGYTPRQVFNIDETGLFWKRMPKRYVHINRYINGNNKALSAGHCFRLLALLL